LLFKLLSPEYNKSANILCPVLNNFFFLQKYFLKKTGHGVVS